MVSHLRKDIKLKQYSPNREVILDFETTGFFIDQGDRVVSIGLVELIDDMETGNFYYGEFDPETDHISEESTRIHGFKLSDLKGKPKFADEVQDILDFIGNSNIVIHNMHFDSLFLKNELTICGIDPSVLTNRFICTVEMSRNVLPIFKVSLDKLCSYFDIPHVRNVHSAIQDARLLSKIYYFLKRKTVTGRNKVSLLRKVSDDMDLDTSFDIDSLRLRKINVRKILSLRLEEWDKG